MSKSGWKWWLSMMVSTLALVVSVASWLVANQTRHAQFDESLAINIDSYAGPGLDATVSCGSNPFVSKPYRVSIINSGHTALTVVSVNMDTDRPLGGVESAHIKMIKLYEQPGEMLSLPLKLDAGDTRSFVTYMPYNIAPSVVTLLCNPLNPLASRSQMARVLIGAKVDLLGKAIHPATVPEAEPTYLFSSDLSSLPALRVTVRTANGLSQTHALSDKASL